MINITNKQDLAIARLTERMELIDVGTSAREIMYTPERPVRGPTQRLLVGSGSEEATRASAGTEPGRMQMEHITSAASQTDDAGEVAVPRRTPSMGQRSSSLLPRTGLASSPTITTLADVEKAMKEEEPEVWSWLYHDETQAAAKIQQKLMAHGTLNTHFSGEVIEVGLPGQKETIPDGPSSLQLIKEMVTMIHRHKLEQKYHMPLYLALCKKGSIACLADKEPHLRNAHVNDIVLFVKERFVLHGQLYWERQWDYLRGPTEMKQVVPNAETENKGMVWVVSHINELGTAMCKSNQEIVAKWKLVSSKQMQAQVLSGYTTVQQIKITWKEVMEAVSVSAAVSVAPAEEESKEQTGGQTGAQTGGAQTRGRRRELPSVEAAYSQGQRDGYQESHSQERDIKWRLKKRMRQGGLSRHIEKASKGANRKGQQRWAGGRIEISSPVKGQQSSAGKTIEGRGSIGGRIRRAVSTVLRYVRSSGGRSQYIIASKERKSGQEVQWFHVRSILECRD